MRKFFRVYTPFIRAGIQEIATYRLNFFCFILGQIFSCFIMYFVWNAVFISSGENAFMGFSMENMVVYIFMSFITGVMSYSEVAYNIGEEIREGSIAMRMIRPVNYQTTFLFKEIGNFTITLTVFVPVVIGLEIYRFISTGAVQFNIALFLLYLVSVVLSYFICFFFNVCFGFLAFVLKNLWGANILKDSIINFMSGAMIPLAFMPTVIRGILQFLPFASLRYTPVMIYMGVYSPAEIVFYLVLQVFWVIAMYALSKFVWKMCLKHLSIQGG